MKLTPVIESLNQVKFLNLDENCFAVFSEFEFSILKLILTKNWSKKIINLLKKWKNLFIYF